MTNGVQAGPARNFINGDWIDSGDVRESLDPATGQAIGSWFAGDEMLAASAIASARSAFDKGGWAASPRQRSAALLEFADRLESRRDELAALIVMENGKLAAEAAGEVMGAVGAVRFSAALARGIFGRTIETAPGNVSLLNREPAGVVSVIVPWNAPLTLLVRSLAPALAAGCTIVAKPAPQTPLIHRAAMECLAACPSLPVGVVNSVNDNGLEVSSLLVTSRYVDVVSFTGSSATGKKIMAAAAPTLKRLSLELGGKAPSVVFEDADIDMAVRELTRGSLIMAGQMCVAAARFIVHDRILDAFRERMAAAYGSVRVGPGGHPESQMGALIDLANRDRLEAVIERAGDEGRMVLKGGRPDGTPRGGAFLTPTLFEIDDPSSGLVQDELFGPVVSLERFADEREAVEKANATRFGLAASVFTRDGARAARVSRAIRAGTVWLNCHTRLNAETETGGFRESGIGRLHGAESLNDFLETKNVYQEVGTV